MGATERFQADQYLANDELLAKFMPNSQRFVLKDMLKGEEGDYFADMIIKLHQRIRDMPKTYETEAIESQNKIVHLHYFLGRIDAWIVEKDMGDSVEEAMGEHQPQLQAYGKCTLYGEGIRLAEWGYISIQELIDNGVELDLHWEPKPVKDVK